MRPLFRWVRRRPIVAHAVWAITWSLVAGLVAAQADASAGLEATHPAVFAVAFAGITVGLHAIGWRLGGRASSADRVRWLAWALPPLAVLLPVLEGL